MRHESGFALVAAVVLLSLAGLAVTSIALLAGQAFKSQALARHSLHSRHDAEYGALTGLVSSAATKEIECRTQESKRGGSTMKRTACRFADTSAFPAESPVIDGARENDFPKFDYNRILKDAVPCNGVPYDCSYRAGSHLSPSSACAGNFCTEIPPPKSDLLSLAGDLSLHTPFAPPAGSDPGFPFVLASSGFFETTAPLLVNRDMLVVAGGDLMISALIVQGAYRVTLVSATGRVEVKRVKGNPLIKAIGRVGVSLPAGDFGIHTLLPPPFEWELVGLRRLQE